MIKTRVPPEEQIVVTKPEEQLEIMEFGQLDTTNVKKESNPNEKGDKS